jgi:hypothetical protein
MKTILYLMTGGLLACASGASDNGDPETPPHVTLGGTATIAPSLVAPSSGFVVPLAADADLTFEGIFCGDPLFGEGDLASDTGRPLAEQPLLWRVANAPMRPRLRGYAVVVPEDYAGRITEGSLYGSSRVLEPLPCGPDCFKGAFTNEAITIDTVFAGCP